MPTLVLKDRVKVTSTTTGTGNFTLGAASTGYQGFTAVGDGNQTYYCIAMQGGAQWEVGYGEVASTGTVLIRQSVYSNSLGDTSFIDFPAGTKEVFVTYPSEQAVYQEVSGSMKLIAGVIEVSEDGSEGTTLPDTAYQAFITKNAYMQSNMQNLSDGALASSDWVCTADNGSDTNNFIDMGMASSQYNYPDYSATKANDGYIISTGNSLALVAGKYGAVTPGAQDIKFIAGSLLDTEERMRITGLDGNVLIGTTTDINGSKLQVIGDIYIDGGFQFVGGGEVADAVLSYSPTINTPANNEFVVKSYVDQVAQAGLDVHTAVQADADSNLDATYTGGGTTPTWDSIVSSSVLATGSAHGLVDGDTIVFDNVAGSGLVAGQEYFVIVYSSNEIQVSETYEGAPVLTLVDGSGYSITSLANAGVGATLEANNNEALVLEGYTVVDGDRVLVLGQDTTTENGVYVQTQTGDAGQPWILVRADDANKYGAGSQYMDAGSYFLVTQGSDAGEAYVNANDGVIVFGVTPIVFNQFSQPTVYTGTSPIVVTGTDISLTTVPATLGGTDQTTVTTGDLLYGSGTDAWGKLGVGSTYQVLRVSAGVPSWGGVALDQSAAISGSLPATNGGTGLNTYAVGDLIYSGTTNTLTKLSGNTSTTKLFLSQTGTGSVSQAPTWSALTNGDISGLGTMSTQNANSVNITGGTVASTKFQAYTETCTTVGTVSTSTYNIDLSLSNIFDITLGNDVTFTFTNAPTSGTAKNCTIILRQDASGNRTATFTNAKYTDGTAPILSTGAGQIDVLTFFTVNGGSFWFGTYAMANVS